MAVDNFSISANLLNVKVLLNVLYFVVDEVAMVDTMIKDSVKHIENSSLRYRSILLSLGMANES